MSRENVEIIRRFWKVREREDAEALFAFIDPAIVLDISTVPGPLAGVYHGHDGVRRCLQEWLEPFETETYHARAETFIDAGDRVVIGSRATGRGKVSGAKVEMPRWAVFRIRNDLVIRIDIFETKAEALEAAGLSE